MNGNQLYKFMDDLLQCLKVDNSYRNKWGKGGEGEIFIPYDTNFHKIC